VTPYPRIVRKHRILASGDFEERTYVDGRLVDQRFYHLTGRRVAHRTRLRVIRGSRAA
jgi:hypothetical protein